MKNSKKLVGSRLALKSEQLKVLGAEDLPAIVGGGNEPPCQAFTCLHTKAN